MKKKRKNEYAKGKPFHITKKSTIIWKYKPTIPISGSVTETSFWQYPDTEQNGEQQGQSRLELQLPGPLPTSVESSSVHLFPFHEVHGTVGELVVGSKKYRTISYPHCL